MFSIHTDGITISSEGEGNQIPGQLTDLPNARVSTSSCRGTNPGPGRNSFKIIILNILRAYVKIDFAYFY